MASASENSISLINFNSIMSIDSSENESEIVEIPTETTPLSPTILDESIDVSLRVLRLAAKGEWALVENILRSADRNKLDLNFRDDLTQLTSLLFAVKDNRVLAADRMLQLGAAVDAQTKDGLGVAHVAAINGTADMVNTLGRHGIPFNEPGGPSSGYPIHLASARIGPDAHPLFLAILSRTVVDRGKDPRFLEDAGGAIPFIYAAEMGNPMIIKELLSVNMDSQVKWRRLDSGDTPLHICCKRGDIDLARFLLDHGADPDTQNNNGQTPLHFTVLSGNDAMLRLMHQARADANIADTEDKTPLHLAAEIGNLQQVETLMDKFRASVLARTKDGSTALHIAALNGHPKTAMTFLKRGVPLQMPNKNGALGLHCAAAMGHLGVVRALLSKAPHSTVDVKTKENYTPLHVAIQNGRASVAEELLGSGANVHSRGGRLSETALHLAADLNGTEAITCSALLVKSGAEVNDAVQNGETALHIAARNGNSALTKLLLNHGADAMSMSKVGESPLHIAAKNCHFPVCSLIVEMVSANKPEAAIVLANAKTDHGDTSLHYTAGIEQDEVHYPMEDQDIIRLLLENGGDVTIQNKGTETAIHTCARSGNDNILSEILEKIGAGGAQIALNKQAKNGWSPLLFASDRGHVNIVKLLLTHHARVDVFDETGRTALHWAADSNQPDVCELLLKHKAFINSKTKAGLTPLHMAAERGHMTVVDVLTKKYSSMIDAGSLDNRTPLHLSAKSGQIETTRNLISLGANPNARDTKGQSPLHLAAESDYPDVVKLFLKMKPDMATLTATDENGFTCAHIAAMKGSVSVIRELMTIDLEMVISARTKTTESTALHLAAAGGHKNAVRVLIAAGANPAMETSNGMTPVHLAAKFGHIDILDVIDKSEWGHCSNKTGLTALHVAAHYGQTDFVRYMIGTIPPTVKSEAPGESNPLMVKELQNEYGLTVLHMAAQSGHESLVRVMLNQGVQVDSPSVLQSVIPLHLAAQCGHVAVVGLLLSRSTTQLHVKDAKGRTSLHLAAMNGHYDMVSLLLGQGSSINSMDSTGYTALHFATKAGHMQVVQLLITSGADPLAETREGKVAMCFAAAYNHYPCLSFLLHHEHDSYLLMDDKKFVFDLMVCGKSNNYKPVEEFILLSHAPIDTAVKLSSLYLELSTKEKERAKDLETVAGHCEDMAVELLAISSTESSPSTILKAVDIRNRPFLDVLIEHEQKKVVSHTTVQRYLTEIWNGGITWGEWKFVAFFFSLTLLPPLWIIFSLPLNNHICRAPIIKFCCHLISHAYLTLLLVFEVLSIVTPIFQVNTILPNWIEWLLLIWLSGLLVSELSNTDTRSGLAFMKMIILFCSASAVIVHISGYIIAFTDLLFPDQTPQDRKVLFQTYLYVRNQLFAVVSMFCFIDYLEFLTVHHLFGPWAIIIRDLMYDLSRFLVILALFVAGFTLHVTSIFQPAYESDDPSEARLANPLETLEMLFFSLFGLVEPDAMPPLHRVPNFSVGILKVVFGVYMMVTLIVLINLLIAMMSDTYQRIQAQSDTEWKFGRAKLIRQMNKKSATPPPVNIFTKLFTVLKVAARNNCYLCSAKAQDDMRIEENIDSYEMPENAGRTSPSPNKRLLDMEDDTIIKVERGHVGLVTIENAVNWKSVVKLFYIFQGSKHEDSQNGTDTQPLLDKDSIA